MDISPPGLWGNPKFINEVKRFGGGEVGCPQALDGMAHGESEIPTESLSQRPPSLSSLEGFPGDFCRWGARPKGRQE